MESSTFELGLRGSLPPKRLAQFFKWRRKNEMTPVFLSVFGVFLMCHLFFFRPVMNLARCGSNQVLVKMLCLDIYSF